MRSRAAVLGMLLAVGSVAVPEMTPSSAGQRARQVVPKDLPPTQDDSGQGKGQSPRPLVVMLQYEHWVGEETTFALYDDGRLIYAPKEKQVRAHGPPLDRFPTFVSGYLSVVLKADELRELRRSLEPGPKFFDLRKSYKLSDRTSQPGTTIYAWRDGKRKRCYVYGNLREDREVRKKAPKEFLDLFDKIAGYRHDQAKPWMPEKVEVLASPLEATWMPYGLEKGLDWWRKDWPDLTSADTRNRGTHYSIYLPPKQFRRFRKLYEKSGSPVRIGGKLFQVTYRFPLPEEGQWFDEMASEEPVRGNDEEKGANRD